MAEGDNMELYWARAHSWSVAEAFWITNTSYDPPTDLFQQNNGAIEKAVRESLTLIFRASYFLKRLLHFTGRDFYGDGQCWNGGRIFRDEIESPATWIDLFDKAEIAVSNDLRKFVRDSNDAPLPTSRAHISDASLRKPIPRDNSLIATIAAMLAAWPGGQYRVARTWKKRRNQSG